MLARPTQPPGGIHAPPLGVARVVGGWGTLDQRTSPTCQAGMDPAWWVGGAREHFTSSLCDVRGAVNSSIFLDTGVLSSSGPSDYYIIIIDSSSHITKTRIKMGGYWVGEVRWASAPHPPTRRATPPGWAETNFPRVSNLPSRH